MIPDLLPTNSAAQLRRRVHQHPELSGAEVQTAQKILQFFSSLNPDETLSELGGTGVAFVFTGVKPGPTVLLRCELDALPIQEENAFAHRSTVAGCAHKCGHDGHMAILAAVGTQLAARRPPRGRVVLLYQPAEETGLGAAAVIKDKQFSQIRPDYVFALHNLPGYPLGQVVVRSGTFSCASRGIIITLIGKTAHAAQPETGISPAAAMCQLIDELSQLPARLGFGNELAFATVVGARLGAKAFGTAPAIAEVMATLRSETDETMQRIVTHIEETAQQLASAQGLRCSLTYEDIFTATVNDPTAVERICAAAHQCQAPLSQIETPLRWSEDFGRFTAIAPGALFGLGAGQHEPALHNADYDFPETLIERGAALFLHIVADCLATKVG